MNNVSTQPPVPLRQCLGDLTPGGRVELRGNHEDKEL
jgi:hypothetical protein